MNNKDKQIHIRVTEKERDNIKELAKKYGYNSVSQYILDRAVSPIVFVENASHFAELSRQISGVTRNINQVAKYVNINRSVENRDLEEIFECQKIILKFMSALKASRNFEMKVIKKEWSYGNNEDTPNKI